MSDYNPTSDETFPRIEECDHEFSKGICNHCKHECDHERREQGESEYENTACQGCGDLCAIEYCSDCDEYLGSDCCGEDVYDEDRHRMELAIDRACDSIKGGDY